MEIKPGEIRDTFGQVSLGEAQVFRGLSVIPILGGPEPKLDYCLPKTARAKGWLSIEETGRVGETLARNAGPKPVLIPVGTILLGGRQNRTTNATVLVGPKSVITMPSSCVERGRWSPRSSSARWHPEWPAERTWERSRRRPSAEGFVEADCEIVPSIKCSLMSTALEGRRRGMGHRSDQHLVWSRVAQELDDAGAYSSTEDLHALHEKHRKEFLEALESFPLLQGQRGAIFVMGSQPIGLEYVSRPDAWADLHDGAIQAFLHLPLQRPKRKADPNAQGIAEEFLARIAGATYDVGDAAGLGVDCMLADADVSGSVLVYEGEVLHAAFAGDPERGMPRKRRMGPFGPRF